MKEMEYRLLNHGYVRFIESWGSDESVIEAARMSTGKGFLGWGPRCTECGVGHREGECRSHVDGGVRTREHGDEKLLGYLRKNHHDTPFEFGGMVIEVQAPIIVFREWHRHRTQSYNEASARYAPLPAFDYVPTIERLMRNGGHLTKQAGSATGAEELTQTNAEKFIHELSIVQASAEALYQQALGWGVPKELARLSMTVGRFSKMRAAANLRNWLGFERLRLAEDAQEEIRVYAQAVGFVLKEVFPRTWELFEKE